MAARFRDIAAQARPAVLALALAAEAWPVGAHAALTLSAKPTQNVTCTGGVCTATAASANLNVTALSGMLASGDAAVVSGAQAADIVVQAPISWASTSRLTLDSHRSITVNKPVTVAGTGAATLLTNDGGTNGGLFFNGKGCLRFWDLAGNLTINAKTFTLVDRVGALAKAVHAKPTGSYAWARSYNAAHLGILTKTPILKPFTGTFEGLGNTISNLAIADDGSDGDVGLFAAIHKGGVVRDINFENLQASAPASTAYLGGLAGENDGGTIVGVNAAVNVSAQYFADSVGGLVGNNDAGTIVRSSTSGSVSSLVQFGSASTGGLAGSNGDGGTVSQSNSTAAVTGIGDTGGLIGTNGSFAESENPLISDSFATGAVAGNEAGGLVGLNSHATIVGSHASGNVQPAPGSTWGADTAGLAASNNGGSISNCYATGSATTNEGQPSAAKAGGLVADNANDGTYVASISQSWSSGNVRGGRYAWAGGLVGMLEGGGEISNTYATGSVTGNSVDGYVGGVVGYYFHGTIAQSYATGAVSTGEYVGGVIGEDGASPGGLSDLYFDTQTTGQNFGIGRSESGNTSGTQGLTTAQFQSGLPGGFASSVWGESGSINGGFPYLLAVPPNPRRR